MIAESIQTCKRDKSPRAPIATHEGFRLFIGPGSMPAATMARAVHGAMAAVTSAGVLSVTLLPDQILNNGDYNYD